MNTEYITLKEALVVTGLAEKTLKEHLRGCVPMIGKNAWFRKEFFDYWKQQFDCKQQKINETPTIINEILEKVF